MGELSAKCECTLSISMLGEGCRYCQPQNYIEILHDQNREMERDLEALREQNQALKEAVEISRHDVNALRKEIAEEIDTWFGDEVSLLRAEAIRKILAKHWR